MVTALPGGRDRGASQAAVPSAAGSAWADAVGPFYDTDGACAALGGVSEQALRGRVNARQLLGLRLAPDGSGRDRMVYPTWQFDGPLLRVLPPVLTAAGYDPQRPATGWTIAAWFTTPDPRLDGLTPAQALAAGHPDRVLAAAQGLAGPSPSSRAAANL